MKFNLEYLTLKFKLIEVLLHEANQDFMDISYSVRDGIITVQIVLLEGATVPTGVESKLKSSFDGYTLNIRKVALSKEDYNRNRDQWKPLNYKWLETPLLTKFEKK